MRTSSSVNLLNEFLVNKKVSLGKGATGEVYSGKNLRDNTDVAVKVIDITTIDNEVTQYLLNMEKIAIMSVNNLHVLKGIKIIQNSMFCYIITELCNGGTLKDMIRMNGPLSEDHSIRILTEILKGECSLIGKGIIHRDLKPANILLHNGQAKIIDFGYCQIKGYQKPTLEYNVGSPSYMAPQAFLDNQYNQKTEIWAVGVTLYECLNGKTFDDGNNMTGVFHEIRKKGLPYRVQVSERCKKIINWCLEQDPKKRPTFVELLNFIIVEQVPPRPPSQSTRTYFSPVENRDFRNQLQQQINSIKPMVNNFSSEPLKKENIMKSEIPFQTKARAVRSNYENYMVGQKSSYFQLGKSKYDKKPIPADKKHVVVRHNSQIFDTQNIPVGLTDRVKSKQSRMGMNPVKTKIFTSFKERNSRKAVNFDYFGIYTDR